MLDSLRDPIWTSVGIFLAAILAVPAGFAVSWLVRKLLQRRRLTFRILSVYSLLARTEELKGRLNVHVDGEPVANIDVLFLEFENSGDQPILRADFEAPLSVEFHSPAKILSAVIHQEEPQSIGAQLVTYDDHAILSPLLLNPGDRVTVKFLLSSESGHFEVSGRVVGIREIQLAKSSRGAFLSLFVAGTFGLALGPLLMAKALVKSEGLDSWSPQFAAGFAMMTVGIGLIQLALWSREFGTLSLRALLSKVMR